MNKLIKHDDTGQRQLKEKANTECFIELDPPYYYHELTERIRKTRAYTKHKNDLPSAHLLGFMYIKTNISLLGVHVTNANKEGGHVEDHIFGLHRECYESFVLNALQQMKMEKKILESFHRNLDNLFSEIHNKIPNINLTEAAVLQTVVRDTCRHYWQWKTSGHVDKYVFLVSSINHLLAQSSLSHQEIYIMLKEFYDLTKEKSHAINELFVKKPSDLTLILDICSDPKHHQPKTILATKEERREIDNLFTNKDIHFIMSLVDLYKTGHSVGKKGGTNCITIPPGTALVSRQPDDFFPLGKMTVTGESKSSYLTSPETENLDSVITIGKKKNSRGDHTYIINNRIRKHLKYDAKKFISFSKKNNSFITNIRIIVDARPKEDRLF